VRRTLKRKPLDAVTVSRFALIAGEAPAFSVLTGWFPDQINFLGKVSENRLASAVCRVTSQVADFAFCWSLRHQLT
jgi:hypothetical protein